ncbi:MAG TPA: FAD-binding oxidoreductase [Jiangellaceae bacterium]
MSYEVSQLRGAVRGAVITPADDSYDKVRAVWNGMIDRRPAIIVRCADPSDVAAAIRFAADNGLPLAVRGGGHNVSGNAIVDDGLVVDLSGMREVHVDAERRRVRAAGGATIGDVDAATQRAGLAVPLGLVSETGIAGLTLGGGVGWLRRAYGLACDNLLAAEVVTATGEIVRASEDENPNLLWALRGGGGNFGVVTSFEYCAYPIGPDVHLTLVFHPWRDAPRAMRHYRDWAPSTPDEVSALGVLWHAPPIDEIPAEYHHEPVFAFAAMHLGEPADGERELAPLREFGDPIANLSGTMPYLEVQQLFDEDYPAHELRYYWKSLYFDRLDDTTLDELAELNAASPSPHSNIDLWQLGGAMSRVGADETAFGDRSASFMIGIEANWENAADDDANIAWARRVFDTLQPRSTGTEYLNFPGFYENGSDGVRRAFGANYERLAKLKKEYDPTNLFRLNQNIEPA